MNELKMENKQKKVLLKEEMLKTLDEWENFKVLKTSTWSNSAEVALPTFTIKNSTESLLEWQEVWNFINLVSFIKVYDEIFHLFHIHPETENFKEDLNQIEERLYQIIHDAFMMWETRTEVNKPSRKILKNVMLEKSSKKSAFTQQGKYVTSDKVHILRSLQMKVWDLWAEYTQLAWTTVNSEKFNYIGGEIQFTFSSSKN